MYNTTQGNKISIHFTIRKFNVSINCKFCGRWFLLFEMEGSLPNLSLQDFYTRCEVHKDTQIMIILTVALLKVAMLTSIINVADCIVAEMENTTTYLQITASIFDS